jgi:hypothetical protein
LEAKFPAIAQAVSKLKLRSTILDGEVVAADENGIPRFQLLQRVQRQPTAPTLYYVLDVLAKEAHLPEWQHVLGTLTFGAKEIPGLQLADLLVYYANRLEREHHWNEPTIIEQSPYVLSVGKPAPKFPYYRLPVAKASLQNLRGDFLRSAPEAP